MNFRLASRRPLAGGSTTGSGVWELGWDFCGVMGIVNVTPDSFSDGGRNFDVERAVENGLAMVDAGATFLDIGGESTRPGADPVDGVEELRRVLPVIERLSGTSGAVISIDSTKPDVVREAVQAGAGLVNDVRGLRDPAMLSVCAELGVPVIIMHMQGEPRTMQRNPVYGNVVAEVETFLREASDRAVAAGVPSVLVDPGIGFGKTIHHNLALLWSIPQLRRVAPVVIGASRKSFMAGLTGENVPERRDPASVAVHLHAAHNGAAIVRVHDVPSHVQALKMWRALQQGG